MADKQPSLDESVLSSILRAERQSAVGFDLSDDSLSAQRKKALDYFKGKMDDVPSLPNRSSVVDTEGADTIETILPDLMEIFTQEDVVEFEPVGDEDVEAARQETDFIRHILFSENKGWMHLYTAFKDALTVKTGVWKWWAETETQTDKRIEVINAEVAELAEMNAEALGLTIADSEAREDGTVELTIISETEKFKVCFKAVPPEDFAVSDDGATVKDCTYCVMRARPRAQELIEDGFDEEKVHTLNTWSPDRDESHARDTVDETDTDGDSAATKLLRRVEIYEHYVYTDLDGEGLKHWKVTTGNDEGLILDYEEVDEKPFSAITPFLTPHRFYGQSMMDKTMEIQRIKTVLTRMLLDSGYFALNGRNEIVQSGIGEFTVQDYVDNRPGGFVRVRQPNTINPIQGGKLHFDTLSAIELVSTMSERRSGVLRNNQGLNPDTMHDTATGQQSMLDMGQRRTRMIARSFAETGFVDLCVGIHGLLRTGAAQPLRARINGQTVQVDPSDWGLRKDMTINIAGGGREQAMRAMQQLLDLIRNVVELQGGANGPIIDLTGIYTVLTKYSDMLPIKGLSGIFTDPQTAQMEERQESPEPDPAVVKAQNDMQIARERLAMDREKQQFDMEMEIRRVNSEEQLAREKAALEARLAMMRGGVNLPDNRPGGNLAR